MMLVPPRLPVPPCGEVCRALKALESSPVLLSRDGDAEGGDDNGLPTSTIVTIIVIAVSVIAVLAALLYLRHVRQSRKRQPTQSYEPYSGTASVQTASNRRLGATRGSGNTISEANRTSVAATNIDRNTSIRSIMTLPKYSNIANEGEQVLGREGERDGVDTIVEFPTDELHEALRDEEMEAMYQIRVTRRAQNAERADRRRLTREARERGDVMALEELRSRQRAATANAEETIDDLRETQGAIRSRRERAVSSVSYHDLGVARHDGSRIRANSTESERVGLLSDAASIAQSTRSPSAQSSYRRISDAGSLAPSVMTQRPRSPSAQSSRHAPHQQHGRIHSVSSVMSLDENGEVSPRSGAATPRLAGRAGSSPEIITEADLGDSDMPPPDYEDVSLDDVRSGATTPMIVDGPPPDYDHRDHQMTESDMGSPNEDSRRSSAHSRRGVGGTPQLPSLRIRELPEIVIEPSTGHPDRGRSP